MIKKVNKSVPLICIMFYCIVFTSRPRTLRDHSKRCPKFFERYELGHKLGLSYAIEFLRVPTRESWYRYAIPL